jgi:hypothetical protein
MDPARYDITLTRGATWPGFALECLDADGAPVDLTGWQAFAEVREDPEGPVVLSLAPFVADPEAQPGIVHFPALPPATTAALPAGGFAWDLVLQSPAGVRTEPLVAGSVRIPTPITRFVS